MNLLSEEKYNEWCREIEGLNNESLKIVSAKKGKMEFMAEHLKNIFQLYFDKDVTVEFKQNSKIIDVKVPVLPMESLSITHDVLDDLLMPVNIRFDNERCLVFELYPEISDKENGVKTETISDVINGGDKS